MKVPCFQCNVTTELDVRFEVKNFVCPNCQNLYTASSDGLRLQRKFNYKHEHVGLQIGQKGTLKGETYTVTGILVKKAYSSFYWREYVLQSSTGDFRYLSEADGHWIFLQEIEEKHNVTNHPPYIDHGEMRLQLYNFTGTEIVSAQGFFDFEIPNHKINVFEYIDPPYVISIERLNGVEDNFFGEHISANEIKKGFPDLPVILKHGTGLVEPFYFNVRNSALIFCVVALLIFVSHGLIYNDRVEKTVLSQDLSFTEFYKKDFISPSFTLEGGSSPMTVSLHSNVDNSWANVQVALINENTNDEVYANKDIEYYHGYTDGENWSEGNNSEEFSICGVEAGKYHLTITPQKPLENLSNDIVTVKVVWNQSSMHNAWIPIIIMGVLMIGIYYLNVNFEQSRWADSDHSPFDQE